MFIVSSFLLSAMTFFLLLLLQMAIGHTLQVAFYKQEERAFQKRRKRFIETDGLRNQDFSSLDSL
jgi:hypothetical protein